MKRPSIVLLAGVIALALPRAAVAGTCSYNPDSSEETGDAFYGRLLRCNASLEDKYFRELGMNNAGSGWGGNWGRTPALRCDDRLPYKRTINAIYLIASQWPRRYAWIAGKMNDLDASCSSDSNAYTQSCVGLWTQLRLPTFEKLTVIERAKVIYHERRHWDDGCSNPHVTCPDKGEKSIVGKQACDRWFSTAGYDGPSPALRPRRRPRRADPYSYSVYILNDYALYSGPSTPMALRDRARVEANAILSTQFVEDTNYSVPPLSCPGGQPLPEDGVCPPVACRPTQVLNPNNQTCQPCNGIRRSPYVCQPCGRGLRPNAARSACVCPNGVAPARGGSCNAKCAEGWYASADGLCRPCPEGKSAQAGSVGAQSCRPCPAGTFSNRRTRSVCRRCGPFQVSRAGSSTCISCRLGQIANATRTSCTTCGAGRFPQRMPPNLVRCAACPAGQRPNRSWNGCEACGAGGSTAGGGHGSLSRLVAADPRSGAVSCGASCPPGLAPSRRGQCVLTCPPNTVANWSYTGCAPRPGMKTGIPRRLR